MQNNVSGRLCYTPAKLIQCVERGLNVCQISTIPSQVAPVTRLSPIWAWYCKFLGGVKFVFESLYLEGLSRCLCVCVHARIHAHLRMLHVYISNGCEVTNQLLMIMIFIRIYSQTTMCYPVSHSPRCSGWYYCFEMLFVAAFGSVLKSRWWLCKDINCVRDAHYLVLQRNTMHCSTHCNTLKAAMCCSARQCVAVHDSVLRYTTVCCSTQQCVAVHDTVIYVYMHIHSRLLGSTVNFKWNRGPITRNETNKTIHTELICAQLTRLYKWNTAYAKWL